MKKLAISFIIMMCLGCFALGTPVLASSAVSGSELTEVKKTEEVTFSVSMKCENCVKKIRENISFEKGVKSLNISLEEKKVTVVYDPAKTSGEKLASAIRKLGFKVDGK